MTRQTGVEQKNLAKIFFSIMDGWGDRYDISILVYGVSIYI